MADIAEIHELLESVRVTLHSSMNPNREQLDRLHNELDSEIRSANKRLRECDTLLADGHRSEAIQLAEQEPNLLELVSILDFPELPEWNDFVAELELTVTPELQIDIATDLNGAYADDEPLERLMRRFRVHSLARAPLRSRIDLLRQIAKRDAGSDYWKDDLKSYEQTRIRQIADETREAITSRNAFDLRRLSDEVHKKQWSVKPDRKVVERLDHAMVEVRQLESVSRLTSLTAEFSEAKSAGDAERAREISDTWDDLAQKCSQESDAFQEAKAAVAPLYRWLRDLDQEEENGRLFAAEIKKLQRTLRSEQSSLEEIYRHYDAVADFEGFDVPDAVQARYEARLTEIEKQRKMKQYITIGGIGLGVIALLVIVAIVLF
ncbi:MAG: hypothetical protein GY758_31015 [Fuerstiella sp.]|jgi:hypothetical protein|nr:hypothetical protein [Fuerstiella sp.]MCP4509626.1 hypothetical protein [Fuerstiella sp.]MDG2128852.1 hypothetical protein [Fuerstiella sp.]